MVLILILVTAWLVGAPASPVSSFAQDKPAEAATQSPPAAPAETPPPAPNSEPSAAKQQATDRTQKTQSAPKTRHGRNRHARKPAQPGEPRKIVIRQGGTDEPSAKILPGMTPQQASEQRQSAETLLSQTEQNLKQLADRSLDAHRQETVAQIHNFVEGARSALKDGDIQRAHTLALKAHLLADDLVKR